MTEPSPSQSDGAGTSSDDAHDATAHLLRSPENARRLRAAIDRLEHGRGEAHGLVDDTQNDRGRRGQELAAALVAIWWQQPHDGDMSHGLLDTCGPDHVLAVSGACRCGWEDREQSFRWSPHLPAMTFGDGRVAAGGGEDPPSVTPR